MSSFKKHYRSIFEMLGCPLTKGTAMSSEELARAEKRLGTSVPTALRDYCLVAGRERRLNTCYHRLLSPAEWWVDQRRLIFMQENQSVLWWGVSTRGHETNDPSVWQGINDEPITWLRESRHLSEFLASILCYQAVRGGLPYCGAADAPENSNYRLDDEWTYFGEVGGAKTYGRANQAICLEMIILPFVDKPRITLSAGAKTKRDLQAIANDLGVRFS
jgi:hypothetical protein